MWVFNFNTNENFNTSFKKLGKNWKKIEINLKKKRNLFL